MSKRILIHVDHKLRDLHSLTYLKVLLEDRYGYRVVLTQAAMDEMLALFRPHLLIYPHVNNPGALRVARLAKAQGGAVALLPTEGAYQNANKGKEEAFVGVGLDWSPVDLMFAWGPEPKDAILRYGTFPPDRIFVCGNPRFDFYLPPLNALLAPREVVCRRHGLDPRRPLVVWTSGFGYPAHWTPDLVQMVQEESPITDKFDFLGEYEQQVIARERTFAALMAVATELPQVQFIIKPHPFETPDFYRHRIAAAGTPNVHCVFDALFWDLLNATDILLSYGGTTLSEAWFFRKPVLWAYFNPAAPIDFPELVAGADRVTSAGELRERIKHYLVGEPLDAQVCQARERFIKRWYLATDGKSGQRVAEAIHRFLEGWPGAEPRAAVSKVLVRALAKRGLKAALGIPPYMPIWRHRADPRRKTATDTELASVEARIRGALRVSTIVGSALGGGQHPAAAQGITTQG